METPLVSVCMLTYNHEPYIAQAIEGVLMQQTPFAVELVIGEDCSTDRTGEICRDYAARYPDRIRLLASGRNIGMLANNRRTLTACRGRYVAICDGDDWWSDPHKLEMQVEAMEADPQIGLCHTRAEVFDQQTGTREPYPAFGDCPEEFDRMLFVNPVCASTALARRDLIERFFREVAPEQRPEWRAGDAPMWLFIASQSRILRLDAMTAGYRVLTDSASHFTVCRKRIAFEDSTWDIRLWFDAHYRAGAHRWKLQRMRSFTALRILYESGTLREYAARWLSDLRRTPRLLLSGRGYRLFFKKVFAR